MPGRRAPSRTVVAAVAACLVTAAGLAALALAGPQRTAPSGDGQAGLGATAAVDRVVVFGRSVLGRPLRAIERGEPQASRRVLVVGCIHGDECAGRPIVRRLAALPPPTGLDLWLVDDLNPDGSLRHVRQNAHGVDLNRNFPYRWRRLQAPGDVYWSGPGPLSEPESRAMAALIRRLRPNVTVWYHQHMRLVDESGGDVGLEARYAREVGLPLRRIARPPGSVSSWQDTTFPGTTAFVVELPPGALPAAAVTRHVGAVLAVARGERSTPPKTGPAPVSPPAAARPAIRQWRIPFGPRRRAEMAAYSARHYGLRAWRLVRPRVIVEHYSDTSTAASVHDTFAPDHPDPELHELPNTCAHFVVDRDGTILQLVDLGTMCRHAVGLNYTAIGIEHVGFSDRQVMGDARQLSASLRLTRWLRCAYDIPVADVIGHAESLSSPFHRERIARLRDQTHGDMARPAMSAYRARLARLGCP